MRLTLRQRMRAAASILVNRPPPSRMLVPDDEIIGPPVGNLWAVIVQMPGGAEAFFMAYHAQDGGWRPYQTASPAEVDDLRKAALLWGDVEGPRLVLRRFTATGTDEVIRP